MHKNNFSKKKFFFSIYKYLCNNAVYYCSLNERKIIYYNRENNEKEITIKLLIVLTINNRLIIYLSNKSGH